MLTHTLATLLFLSLASASPPSPAASSSPLGASYQAILPSLSTTPITGSITGSTNANGTGTFFIVSLASIPSTGGPYIYHIHQSPVPSNGNCTGTGPHLDPQSRGEKPACDASKPETCQVGDLAGKHGAINTTSYSAQYSDPFLSTMPGNAAYFGNRSVVVHNGAGTRLTCANFTLQQLGQGVPGSVTSLLPQATGTVGSGSGSGAGASSAPAAVANATATRPAVSTSASAVPTNGTGAFKGAAAAGRSSGIVTATGGALVAAAVVAWLL